MSENQLLKEQAADTRLIAEFDTGIKNIKANESYKAYLAGKKLFDEVAELKKARSLGTEEVITGPRNWGCPHRKCCPRIA